MSFPGVFRDRQKVFGIQASKQTRGELLALEGGGEESEQRCPAASEVSLLTHISADATPPLCDFHFVAALFARGDSKKLSSPHHAIISANKQGASLPTCPPVYDTTTPLAFKG